MYRMTSGRLISYIKTIYFIGCITLILIPSFTILGIGLKMKTSNVYTDIDYNKTITDLENFCNSSCYINKYNCSDTIAKRASNISRDSLASLGVCFGKFTKTGKFTLHVTALDYLAQYAKYKIWLKNTAEMSYMYGNHVLKAHINKMTEDTPEHQGVIIYSSNELPLVNTLKTFFIYLY